MKKFILLLIICQSQLSFSQDKQSHYYSLNGKTNKCKTEKSNEHSSGIQLTTDRFGNENTAYSFSQERNSFISLGEEFEFLSGKNAKFSFSIWFKRTDLNKSNIILVSKYGNSMCNEDEREVVFNISPENKLRFIYYTTSYFKDLRIIDSKISIKDTNWHHAVVTYNDKKESNNGLDRVKLYLDGKELEIELIRSEGNLGHIQNTKSYFCLGSALGSKEQICIFKDKGGTFEGILDDINIYSRRISKWRVIRLYKQKNKTKAQHAL